MFGMDPEYWEEYFSRPRNQNLVKGNVGRHPNAWGGLPKELYPGYHPSKEVTMENLTGFPIPDHRGGGKISHWSRDRWTVDEYYLMRRFALINNVKVDVKRRPIVTFELDKSYNGRAGFWVHWPDLEKQTSDIGVVNAQDMGNPKAYFLEQLLNEWRHSRISSTTAIHHMQKIADTELVNHIRTSPR